jgi:hypothetical protein
MKTFRAPNGRNVRLIQQFSIILSQDERKVKKMEININIFMYLSLMC